MEKAHLGNGLPAIKQKAKNVDAQIFPPTKQKAKDAELKC